MLPSSRLGFFYSFQSSCLKLFFSIHFRSLTLPSSDNPILHVFPPSVNSQSSKLPFYPLTFLFFLHPSLFVLSILLSFRLFLHLFLTSQPNIFSYLLTLAFYLRSCVLYPQSYFLTFLLSFSLFNFPIFSNLL